MLGLVGFVTVVCLLHFFFFFSSRRRHTRLQGDWSSDVCSSDLYQAGPKLPLMVFAHGGVHGNVGTNYVNVLRELLQQGYAVVAPDYRGSAGYGQIGRASCRERV